MTFRQFFFVLTILTTTSDAFSQPPVKPLEVLHWWTSGSESSAIKQLEIRAHENQIAWKNLAIAGLAGESAINTLQIRSLSSNPPDVAQVKGPSIQVWAKTDLLLPLTDIAVKNKWDEKIPASLRDYFKYQGQYVAAPFNIHRVNWLWIKSDIFEQLNLSYPETLKDFLEVCTHIKAAGYTPIALGHEPWQITMIFESIALAVMGPALYRKAFLHKDSDALRHHTLQQALVYLKKIKPFTNPQRQGKDWVTTAHHYMQHDAAMWFMGDWAQGEFQLIQKKVNQDLRCIPAPGTKDYFSVNIDSFVFFNKFDAKKSSQQLQVAQMILEPEFQTQFNRLKGSIPILKSFEIIDPNSCERISQQTFENASKNNMLVPSLAHFMTLGRASQFAVFDIISTFFHQEDADIDETMRHLRAAVLADKL